MRSFMMLLGMILISASAHSATWYVPDDYSTIQGAIDAASNGDTIIVEPGTYVESIDFLGKAVTLMSEQGADVTVIDGNQAGSVVTCLSGEGQSTVLDGFTITNGYAYFTGGGMYNENSDPTVKNCVFSNNEVHAYNYDSAYGGGMLNSQSSPTVTNCIFSDNSAFGLFIHGSPPLWLPGHGGGMSNLYYSNPKVEDCLFIGNRADDWGGGMCNHDNSNPTVINCSFSENRALEGGGMFLKHYCNPTVTDCTFSGNAAAEGGGMYLDTHCNPEVTKCTFEGNCIEGIGGGMYILNNSNPSISNCNFTENDAFFGGGIYNNYSNPKMSDCIFSNNSASYHKQYMEGGEGGGVYNFDSSPSMTNCIFIMNQADGGGYSHDGNPGKGGGMCNENSSPTVSCCIFSNNTANTPAGPHIKFGHGGGMSNAGGSPVVTSCIFSNNSATAGNPTIDHSYGGGMCNLGSTTIITNCTFHGNYSSHGGGGICNVQNAITTAINSILWNNDAPEGPEIWIGDISTLTISNSDVKDGLTSVHADPGCSLDWGSGNIDADPFFLDPLNDDYHLSYASPCIDAGDNNAPSLPATDFEGDPRFFPGNGKGVFVGSSTSGVIVDMGADEYCLMKKQMFTSR
ncbi:MAG: right-handed parallel beta-helix repeat-containing protein [Planctomycetota bacterium]